jgi:hypothetical protein
MKARRKKLVQSATKSLEDANSRVNAFVDRIEKTYGDDFGGYLSNTPCEEKLALAKEILYLQLALEKFESVIKANA